MNPFDLPNDDTPRRSHQSKRKNGVLLLLVGACVLLLAIVAAIMIRREMIISEAKKDGDRIRQIDKEIRQIDQEESELQFREEMLKFDQREKGVTQVEPRNTPKANHEIKLPRDEASTARRAVLVKEASEIFNRRPGWAENSGLWGNP